MHDDHGHVAMPKLYGAPAYARPPVTPVAPTERPFDPDDLPIESERTSEDDEVVVSAQADSPVTDHAAAPNAHDTKPSPSGRAHRLRLPRLGRSRP